MGKSISSMFNVGDDILSMSKIPLYIPAVASIISNVSLAYGKNINIWLLRG
ncbi:MAG: hypothetical protein BWX61_00845 [Bacteroidetes bacterium ADurb.Bin035]|nr:MAG: hypothetical protein BWX61_00845 [Bacteroidetes bacterium ADurb.Bin035]